MSKKIQFAFDVSGLSTYIDESEDLISKLVYGAQTLQMPGLQVIAGKKSDFKLTRVDNEIYFKNLQCGWGASGSTTFDQVTIEVEALMLQDELCPTDFDDKYLGQLSVSGSTPETFPFEQFIIETKTKKMTDEIDKLAWVGNKTTGSGNQALVDGYIAKLTTDCVYVAAAATASTSANILGKVRAMVGGVDERIYDVDDLTLFMSVAEFKILIDAMVAENLYNYNGDVNGKTLEVLLQPHGLKIKAMHGLRGSTTWILTPVSNMVFGTDLLDETDYINSWYEKKGRQVLVESAFKLGFGYEYDFMVVTNLDVS
jgi:hypothetical protein